MRKSGDSHTTTYARDPNTHRIIQITYPDNSSESFSYDTYGQVLTHQLKNGNYVHYKYDTPGLLSAKTNPTDSTSYSTSLPQTTYTYYTAEDLKPGWIGRLKTETSPANVSGFGASETYEYDREFVGDVMSGGPVGGRGLITKITHADGRFRSFLYNIFGDKVSETNELNQTTEYQYDDYGRLRYVIDPMVSGEQGHHIESFDYTPANGGSSNSHTTSSVTTHETRAHKVTTNVYDRNWRKTSTTQDPYGSDPATTWFHYDDLGNQDYMTDPRGGYSGNEAYTTYTEYDQLNRVKKITQPLTGVQTHITEYDYDSEGRGRVWRIHRPDQTIEEKTYDKMNRVLTDTVPKDANTSIITTFTYNPSGTIATVEDGEHHITTFEYNASDERTRMIYPGNQQSQYWSYDAAHNLKNRTTVNGEIQSFAYDNRNRKIAMRWSNAVDFSDFRYDDVGRLIFAQNPYSTIVRGYDEAGRMNLDQQTMPSVAPTPVALIERPRVVSSKTHGSAGNFDIALPLSGNPGIESRSGGSYRIVATFARSVTLINSSLVSGTGYIGSPTATGTETGGTQITINLSGVITAQKIMIRLGVLDGDVYDDIVIPMHVLFGDVTANGGVNASDTSATKSAIGAALNNSNFRKDVNASGNINATDVTIVKNNQGNAAPTPPPPGRQIDVGYQHDEDGRVKQIYVNDAGYDYTQRYDGMGRLWQISVTGGALQYQYTYDKASNVIRRSSANGAWIDYQPDAINRVGALKVNLPSAQPMPYGTPSPRNYFTGEVYGYDPMNRLISIIRDEQPGIGDSFDYYWNGELQRAQYAIPVATPPPTPTPTPTPPAPTPTATPPDPTPTPQITVDGPWCDQESGCTCDNGNTCGAVSERRQLNVPTGTGAITLQIVPYPGYSGNVRYHIGGGTSDCQEFTLYSGESIPVQNGNFIRFCAGALGAQLGAVMVTVVDVATNSPVGTMSFSNGFNGFSPYAPSQPRIVNYALDKAGNRTGVTADGILFSYQPNSLNQYNTTAHGDSIYNGSEHEISSYRGVDYAYLNDTRLARVSITDGSGLHLYRLGYDALGRLVRRTSSDGPRMSVTYYIYDGERPILELDSTGTITARNVYGRGLDEILERNDGHGNYFMQDHEGSVIAVLSGEGLLREWYRYDAFGAPTIRDANGAIQTLPNGQPVSAINNRFMFTGREYVSQFGFYEYRARAYHPMLGRFMSEDPMLFDAGDYNLFRYCHNEPLDLTDPMGLYGRGPGDDFSNEWTDKEWAKCEKNQNRAIEIDKAAKAVIDHAIANGKDKASQAVAKVFKEELGTADRKTMQKVSNYLGKRIAALQDDGRHGYWAHPQTDRQIRENAHRPPETTPAWTHLGDKNIYLNVGRWSDRQLVWSIDHEAGHSAAMFRDYGYIFEKQKWFYNAMGSRRLLMNADTETELAHMLGAP